jgi:asparagine synthase (glutamine-hydrolysing)
MNTLQAHRGPDGEGLWMHAHTMAGFAHRRLSIIDLQTGAQPIGTESGNWIVYNGELYNYIELREEIGANHFRTASDTEVVLRAYEKWGEDALPRLRGMFAFAIWDERQGKLFCARDRFGIKPFYYAVVNEIFYFSSEIKALIPFLPSVETNSEGLKDYLTFQYCLHGKTMFRGVEELQPAHQITVKNGGVYTSRYWQVYYDIDYSHTELYFQERLRETVMDSIRCHVRSDVPIGGYVSGGIDSSVVASLAADVCEGAYQGFTGKFTEGEGYDESEYARALAKYKGFELLELDMGVRDFIENIEKIMYHMDQPAAGPGILPQYMVARLAAKHRKVVLGGQGGDEIFGGYARYLVAYFEQCVRAAIDGTADNGYIVVTYQSIIPNLVTLREYKPMLQEFWREGLFDDADKRYFRLVNRAPLLGDEVKWKALGKYSPYEAFREIYLSDNIRSESYFDRMTHFDFKASLPALLQVEDRVCMAHGLESRVPLLDSRVVEMAATMPANVKFKNGTLKNGFKDAFADKLPDEIINRKSKMGFPVPFSDWVQNGAREFVTDIFSTRQARGRQYIDNSKVLEKLGRETKFGRNIWGYLCLEFWQRQFHDRAGEFKKMV